MNDAAEILGKDGACICMIDYDGFKVSLYSIDGELYEVFFLPH